MPGRILLLLHYTARTDVLHGTHVDEPAENIVTEGKLITGKLLVKRALLLRQPCAEYFSECNIALTLTTFYRRPWQPYVTSGLVRIAVPAFQVI